MNQVQRFLYANTSRVLESNRLTKRKILFSNEVTPSTFRKRSVAINRFDGSYERSVIQTENYSSSFSCDVEQADFWDFLYSDRWNDKGIVRVLSGELYTALDFRLKEMLQEDVISQHVTFAYLKVKSENSERKLIDLSPETVRVEFTYYNRKKEKISFKSEYNLEDYEDIEIQSTTSSNSDAALEKQPPSDIVSLVNIFGEFSDMQTESMPEVYHAMSANMASPSAQLVNINLRHFSCPMSREIECDAESVCSSLENEIQKGEWITKEINERSGSRRGKFRTVIHVSRWLSKPRVSRKKTFSTKTSKTDMDISDANSKENLLMPISIDINLSVLGKIMEREKCLKVKEMSSKDCKKFFLSDERLIKMNKKLKVDKGSEKPDPTFRNLSGRKEKRSDIKNMQKFASAVLGMIDSPSIYRTLIWMGNCDEDKKAKLPDSILSSSRHAGFDVEEKDEEEVDEEATQIKKESFMIRNNRSMVRTFTLHPKIFTSPTEFRSLNIRRLVRSYSEEFYDKLYSWEKNVESITFRNSKKKISIPNFSSERLEVSSEMALKALDNFIVRKERVISSKGATFISIAFIRPIYLNKLFF